MCAVVFVVLFNLLATLTYCRWHPKQLKQLFISMGYLVTDICGERTVIVQSFSLNDRQRKQLRVRRHKQAQTAHNRAIITYKHSGPSDGGGAGWSGNASENLHSTLKCRPDLDPVLTPRHSSRALLYKHQSSRVSSKQRKTKTQPVKTYCLLTFMSEGRAQAVKMVASRPTFNIFPPGGDTNTMHSWWNRVI